MKKHYESSRFRCIVATVLVVVLAAVAVWGWSSTFAVAKTTTDNSKTTNIDKTSEKRPVVATIFAYNWREDQNWPADQFEHPIYSKSTWNRDEPEFWNYMLDELLLSKIPLVLLHGRGCMDAHNTSDTRDASGKMCPRKLSKFVEAVERADASDSIRVGMWDDTGSYMGARNAVLGTTGRFDMANRTNWMFFWDYNIKIFFDTIPQKLWYLWDGKPVIASWVLSNSFFYNQRYHASQMLLWIKGQFYERYGLEPMFILDDTWLWQDHTITPDIAAGAFAWFRPPFESHRIIDYNDGTWAAGVPSFRNPRSVPGCGEECREITRDDGAVLDELLSLGHTSEFIMLEGWTNMVEAGGFYRSDNWTYPTQYINMVRDVCDPNPEKLKFEAEGADYFYDTTDENLGGQYSYRALDVGALPGHMGWYVGWIDAGEWLEYTHVKLGCGTYSFKARVATYHDEASLQLGLPGASPVTLPNTLYEFAEVNIGDVQLSAGVYDLRISFLTGGMNIDWYALEKVNDICA